MKSRIRNPFPKRLLGINLTNEHKDALSEIAESEGIELVLHGGDMAGEQIGFLCGFGGFQPAAKREDKITEECLVFAGIDGNDLNRLLKTLREKEVKIDLKAMVTATNQSWSLAELVTELKKEHEYMNGGRKNG